MLVIHATWIFTARQISRCTFHACSEAFDVDRFIAGTRGHGVQVAAFLPSGSQRPVRLDLAQLHDMLDALQLHASAQHVRYWKVHGWCDAAVAAAAAPAAPASAAAAAAAAVSALQQSCCL